MAIPKLLSCEKPLQTCTPPDFKFYPNKLTNETFLPYGITLNCLFFIIKCIVKCNECEHTITSFIIYLAKIIFKISRVTKTKWDRLLVFAQQTVYNVRCEMRQGSASLTSIPFPLHSHSIRFIGHDDGHSLIYYGSNHG